MENFNYQRFCLMFIFICSVFLIIGCSGGLETNHWIGEEGEEQEPPTVINTINADGADGVALNTKIGATFSKEMAPATINTETFIVMQGTTEVAGSVDYTGVTAVFTPASYLDPYTTYTATVTTGAKDLAGNAMAADYVWSFTTGGELDTTPPTVTNTVPGNGDRGVAINTKVSATFSEAMDPLTINTNTFTLMLGTNTVPGTVVYSGVTAVFTPTSDLDYDTTYTATVTTGAKDLAGNAMTEDYVWNFTTGVEPDDTPPTVTHTVPVDGAEGVAINTKVSATFSEAMDPLTLTTDTFTLKESTTDVNVTGTVVYSGKTAVFTPGIVLKILTNYTATVTTGAKDLAGNAMTEDYVWTFTTGEEEDTTKPTVILVDPADEAIGVALDNQVYATFSEAMDPLTLTTETFTVTGDGFPMPGGTVDYDPLTDIATFKPLNDFDPDTTYTATITTGATDLAGNRLEGNTGEEGEASDYVWSFTTASEPVVNLGLASSFGIASTAGVTNTTTEPITDIHGDAVLNPNATCNAVTVDTEGGFGLCGGAPPTISGKVISSQYSEDVTPQQVTDDLRAAYLALTPANMPGGTSIAAGTTLGEQEGAALVEGDNLFYPGVYTSNTSILITGDLTLDAQGDPNASFVFQSESTIGTAPGARILLVGEAKASNVWWQAGSAATLDTNTIWQGNILAYSDVTMRTGATSCGRLFAGAFTDGAFVFDSNVVSVPGDANAPPTCQ